MKHKKDNPSEFAPFLYTWNYLYLILLLISIVLLFQWSFYVGGIGLGIWGILFIIEVIHIKRRKDEIAEYIQSLIFTLDSTTNDAFLHLPLPYVIVDLEGTIRWYNSNFEEMIDEKNMMGMSIDKLICDFQYSLFQKGTKQFVKQVEINKKQFKAFVQLMEMKKEQKKSTPKYVYTIYFVENTEQVQLQQQYENDQPLVGLIYIDNYDEVMENLEDVRRPLLLAVIEKKVNAMAQQVEAVIKKFERDKYLIFFPKRNLEIIQKNKFSILDEVRKIEIGNTIPVTLSMGIGMNGSNYIENLSFARAGVDFALARGGDQAIIKDKDKLSFFGGKAKEVEKSTRVKARVKSYALRELIEDCDQVIVMGHKNMDIDCLGAAMGIYRAAKTFEKSAYIVLGNISLAIESIYQRIVDSGKYKDLFITPDAAKAMMTEKTLFVIVDVHRPNYTECEELISMSKQVVVIDHHRKSVEFIENAVLTYLEPYASSTSELVTEILQYIKEKIKINTIEADALLAGITVDTKNFVFKTGVRTFEAASFLRRSGADSTRVRALFKNDMETFRAKSSTVSTAEIFKEHIAISVCPENCPNAVVVAAQAADELLTIQGVQASFVMVQKEDQIMISGRSLGEVNIQMILEKLGGGGHMTVAGAQLKQVTIQEAKILLKQAIQSYLQEGEQQ